MLKQTLSIISHAVELDSSMNPKQRSEFMRFVRRWNNGDDLAVPRQRITTRRACEILGVNGSTFWRYRLLKPQYQALTPIPVENREHFYYLDEIENLRDGKHPVTGVVIEPDKQTTSEVVCTAVS